MKPGSALRLTAWFMVVWMVALSGPHHAVAALVPTEGAAPRSAAEARAHINAFLAREAVQDILKAQGIDPREAERRAAGLSDDEAIDTARQLDRMPAGGSTVGIVVGAMLLVFFVLLILDLLGLTNVFPFVKKHR
jgi:hypothetical protein